MQQNCRCDKKVFISPVKKRLAKKYNKIYPSYVLNDAKVQLATRQKHLVLILDSRLCFIEHVNNKINKCNKIICMMKRRSLALSIKILLTIYNKNYPSLMLNEAKVQFATSQKYLVLTFSVRFRLKTSFY